jgi:Co/Zn/Cd efflux system component
MRGHNNSGQIKEHDMSNHEKNLYIALMLSTVLMMINIVAVTSGIADSYYSQLTDWLNSL